MAVCPVKAITVRNHSIALNETLCIGCKLCGLACPFGAIIPGGTPVPRFEFNVGQYTYVNTPYETDPMYLREFAVEERLVPELRHRSKDRGGEMRPVPFERQRTRLRGRLPHKALELVDDASPHSLGFIGDSRHPLNRKSWDREPCRRGNRMNASQLLMLSVGIFGLGSLACLFPEGRRGLAVSGLTGMGGSVFGILAVIASLANKPQSLSLPAALPFGQLSFEMDGLSMLMVAMICLVAARSLYSLSYTINGREEGYGLLGFLMNLLTAVMLLVVTVSNTFYFLVFWEMMTLVSYFLVTFDSRQEKAVRAGYLYMLIAHAGGALIMLAILLFFINTGSFEFSALRTATLAAPLRSLIFLLAFIGFGAKAGMVPLHMWMPPAYAAASSHAAGAHVHCHEKDRHLWHPALLCGSARPSFLWWGMLVLVFGILSAGLGALFALSEKELKRVLAYSSIENVEIILIGIGTGMAGLASGSQPVALLGFLAALYHSLNHSFFKGLLFLGAGAIENQTRTGDLNKMGGLARRMPWTGLAFLTGALAVSALPPFNGFVSEWFAFQALFSGSLQSGFAMRASLPLTAALLALA